MPPLSVKGMMWPWGLFVASVVSGLVARPPSTRARASSPTLEQLLPGR
jgi:hypothetical protein